MTVLTNFRLDDDLHKAFRIFCIQNDIVMSERLREYITLDLQSDCMTELPAPIKRNKSKEKALNDWLETEWGEPDANQHANRYRWEDTV